MTTADSEEVTRVTTVILLPPEREADLLMLAHEWTAGWLIRGAIWMRPEDITPDDSFIPNAPPRVRAWVIGRNGSAEVSLFDEIARREIDLLRFVAVRSVEPDSAVNADLDSAVSVLQEHLTLARPTRTRIQNINLIFGPTRQSGGSADHLVEPGTHLNIVVSPEDRRSPNSFDSFSRHSSPEQWAGFLLAHTVTAAGLWATVPNGPYDGALPDDFMYHTQLQRVSVRGVLTGALVVNIGLEAMKLVTRDESPLADPTIAYEESDLRIMTAEEEEKATRQLVDIVLALGSSQLSYRAVEGPPGRRRTRVPFVRQAWDVIVFGWDKLRDTPRWFSRRTQRKLSRKATEALHGAEGDIEVDVRGVLGYDDAQHVDVLARINGRREKVYAEFHAPVPARRFDVDGSLFQGVRQACFALLDGSPLPEGYAMPTVWADGGKPLVVRSTSLLVPDWREQWQPPEAFALDMSNHSHLEQDPQYWLDVEFANDWSDELDRRTGRISDREMALRDRLGSLRAEQLENDDLLDDAVSDLESLIDEVAWLREDLADLESIEGAEDDGHAVDELGEGLGDAESVDGGVDDGVTVQELAAVTSVEAGGDDDS